MLGIGGLIALGTAFILSLINAGAVAELRRVTERQGREIEALKKGAATPASVGASPAPSAVMEPLHQPETRMPPSPVLTAPLTPPPTLTPPVPKPAPHRTLERQFGGRAFVWLGGIALALAGFFLVKYSIDTGLLTESVRVVLGVLFGLALLGGSYAVRSRTTIADGTRIAQALAGAGIADLYGSLFAGTTLYHLMPSWLGFAAMAATTATALLLSLRYGAPIAALGLIGGYATPMLIQGEPNAPLLFGYLYLVFGGLAVVIRRQNWHWLSVPAALIAFAWVVVWLLGGMAFNEGPSLSLFLMGVGATAALAGRGTAEGGSLQAQILLRYLAPAGSLLLMACVTYATNFGGFEWAMFGLFSAGAIVLAWFDDRSYVFAPWFALAVNLAMVLGWTGAVPTNLTTVIVCFSLLFTASGQLLLTRSANPTSWAGLSAAALLGYFLLAHQRLQYVVLLSLGGNADLFWAVIASAASGLLVFAATRSFVVHAETPLRHRLQAIFCAVATALLSIGFAILLEQEFLSFAVAAEILALCWIATRVDVPALRFIAQALTALFAVLLLPVLASIAAATMSDTPATAAEFTHSLTTLLFRFGLPAAMFAGASLLLRKERDDIFVRVLELGAIALTALMFHRLVELAFLGRAENIGLIAGSVFTDMLFLLSLACLRLAARDQRVAVLWGGCALAVLAVARVVGFGLLLDNPLVAHELVGAWPLANALLLAYALPAAAGLAIARELAQTTMPKPATWAANIAAYVLAFIFVSLSVRQFYSGTYLDAHGVGSAEIYTYSAVWLIAGIALLFAAVLRKDMTMRIASLALLLLTVGKVFLYDASELTGLWRVVSFLGLGLSLLGLSWFYSRFVFVSEKPAESTPPPP